MKEIIPTEMNSTKSVHLHIPDLPATAMAILPLPLQPFHLEKKKEHSQGKIRAKIPQTGCSQAVISITDKAKSPIVNVNGL